MLNIVSPINQLGYGLTGLNIVKSLCKKTDIALWPIGNPEVTNQEDASIISQCLNNKIMPNFNDPCIKIWHQHDMSQFAVRGKRIGFPIFELDEFNQIEKHNLQSLDNIFVCSKWAQNVIINNLNGFNTDNVNIVHLGVDTGIFQPSTIQDNNKTIFFNCGKWEVRKGHDVISNIFNKAFNKDDNVELWMMCENPFLNETQQKEWIDLYLNSKLANKIKIISRKNTQKEVYNIMSQVDCGIFPSRAEGWNLELLEMLSCGKHVITTNYSAHTEFCNSENAHLVDIKNYELAYDGKWFHGVCGKWATIDNDAIDQFVYHMRNIHTLKQNKQLQINDNGVKTSQSFTWDKSAEAILSYV